ncbi:nitrate/sulfonate/bicarbonate ABC transporter periplasmic protein [Klebsiella pneumoniae]|uniref:Nitrate/sulfonate/bicarbonate ABC transporter periplasmic protein n=1 Tax=Klebsiella pneumoniae TaxID=573 RepID=A0A2X3E2E2_KLEPN|nr:nitrate/sulfonate/bicarbonate ABC transporter periplasmic protein [Klebsiella pneumoniae]
MRLSFSGRVAAALMLLALGGYATAQERLTLRIADQKGGMRSQLEAANALQNLPYDIKWAEFPAAAPLAEALNAGAVDAGIIGDAPLLFALANGAPVKAIAVDKSNPAGTAVLVSPGSTLKSGADLKGKRIATGKGSIGHFVALKALEQAGISPKEVQWGVPRPGGRQSGVAKRFGGRLGDLGALHHPNGEDQRGADPGERQRAAAGEYLPRGNGFRA